MEALYGSSLLLGGHVHEKMNTNSKYEWNIGFIKLINRLECPYCGESLISKGILKTCRCGFYCLGSPKTLVYTEKISGKTSRNNYDIDKCPECDRTDFNEDLKHAEIICKCGLVIHGPPGYSNLRKISYDSFKGV